MGGLSLAFPRLDQTDLLRITLPATYILLSITYFLLGNGEYRIENKH